MAGASAPNAGADPASAASRQASGSHEGTASVSADSLPQPVKADGAIPDLSVALAEPNKGGLPLDEPETHKLAQRGIWDDFLRKPNEGWWPYTKRLCSEGHSVPDAFLTVAASQIGQIMLTCPNALWKTGIVSGGIFMIVAIMGSFWTIYLMNALYCEFKRYKIAKGEKLTHATQYHDVMSHHAGKIIGYTAEVFVILQLIGTGIAQVIACAGDWYSIDKSYSKRDLQIIWGAILQLFVFFPNFRHFRILNILALAGTTMTAVWLLYEASAQGFADQRKIRLWPEEVVSATAVISAPQYFFTGAAVLLNALGGHAIAIEMMDAMETPREYTIAYTGGWAWTLFLIIPPSIAVDLAFPTSISGADNVYGIMPMSNAKVASVALMIIHQIAAFCYYLAPVFFIWERFIGTHNKPWYIRLPSRLPVSLFIWLAAMAFPFYGAINSLMASISVPFTAFALPCLIYNYVYRNKERRDNAPLLPWKWLTTFNWKPIFTINLVTGIVFVGFGATAIAYSIKTIVDNARTYGLFAACYQCPANWKTFLKNPDMNEWQSG